MSIFFCHWFVDWNSKKCVERFLKYIYFLDVIKNITDPEKPQTLEELDIISENDVTIKVTPNCCIIKIYLTPTVPHCSLATLIGKTVSSMLY